MGYHYPYEIEPVKQQAADATDIRFDFKPNRTDRLIALAAIIATSIWAAVAAY